MKQNRSLQTGTKKEWNVKLKFIRFNRNIIPIAVTFGVVSLILLMIIQLLTATEIKPGYTAPDKIIVKPQFLSKNNMSASIGEVSQNSTIIVPVNYINSSNHEFQIYSIRTSCGCTTVQDFAPCNLKPDEELLINVKVSLKAKPLGLFTELVEGLNSAGETVLNFSITGSIVPLISTDKTLYKLHYDSHSGLLDLAEGVAVILKNSAVPLKNISVRVPAPWADLVRFSLPTSLEADEVVTATLSITALPSGDKEYFDINILGSQSVVTAAKVKIECHPADNLPSEILFRRGTGLLSHRILSNYRDGTVKAVGKDIIVDVDAADNYFVKINNLESLNMISETIGGVVVNPSNGMPRVIPVRVK